MLLQDRLLTEGEAAERLNISLPCLRNYRRLGIGPRPTLLGHKLIRYEQNSIRDFVDERTAQTHSLRAKFDSRFCRRAHCRTWEREDGPQAQLDRAEAAKEEK